MTDLPALPVIPLPGSAPWTSAHDWGGKLAERFPDQDADQFAQACEYNGFGPVSDLAIITFVMENQGEHDGEAWVWRITFDNGAIWTAKGSCDYTGWDCQSWLDWERFGVVDASITTTETDEPPIPQHSPEAKP